MGAMGQAGAKGVFSRRFSEKYSSEESHLSLGANLKVAGAILDGGTLSTGGHNNANHNAVMHHRDGDEMHMHMHVHGHRQRGG